MTEKKYTILERLYKNNVKCAEFFDIVYSEDTSEWIQRQGKPEKFRYVSGDGKILTVKKTLKYIENLVIPPNWQDTLINPNPKGHILSVGYDAKKRKQYLYHEKWSEARRLINSYSLILFGEALGDLRTHYKKLLKFKLGTKEYCLGAFLYLLDETVIRVGNKHYFDENGTVGLATLRCEHVRNKNGRVYLDFPGKSGKDHSIHIKNTKLKNILLDLCKNGQEYIFSYQYNDTICELSPSQVNDTIKEVGGYDIISAKDFRSWHASRIVFETIKSHVDEKMTDTQRKKLLLRAFDGAAEKLGNTRTMIRNSYAHSETIEVIEERKFDSYYLKVQGTKKLRNLTQSESEFLAFLKLLYEENIIFEHAIK